MRRRLALAVAAMGYSRLITIVLQLAMVPALAMAWGLPLYGQWLMLATVPLFIAAGDLGFNTAAGNRIIAEMARGELDEALASFRAGWAMIAGMGLVLLAVMAVLVLAMPGRWLHVEGGMTSEKARAVFAVMALYGIAALQWPLYSAFPRAVGRLHHSTLIEATTLLAEGLSVMAVAVAGGSPLAAALAYLVARIAGIACHVVLARSCAPWLSHGGTPLMRQRVREMARPAIAAMLLPLSFAGYLQGAALAVGAAGGAAMVPVFTTARTLSRLGLQLVLTFCIPLTPEYTAAQATGNRSRLALIGGAVFMFSALTGVVIAAGLALFGPDILRLWTNGLVRAPDAMFALMAAGTLAAILWNTLSNLLLAINRHETYTYVCVVAAAATIGLTYVLVGRMGVTGAALAGLCFDLLMAAVVLFVLRRNVGPLAIGIEPLRAMVPHRWRSRGD